MEFKVIPSLIRALRPSSLLMRFNSQLFTSLSRLSVHPKFYSILKKSNGINLLTYEVDSRKKKMKATRRARAAQGGYDEDGTLQMLGVIRKDWAAVRIQNLARTRLRLSGFYEKSNSLYIPKK